jgi:hypothetical protein
MYTAHCSGAGSQKVVRKPEAAGLVLALSMDPAFPRHPPAKRASPFLRARERGLAPALCQSGRGSCRSTWDRPPMSGRSPCVSQRSNVPVMHLGVARHPPTRPARPALEGSGTGLAPLARRRLWALVLSISDRAPGEWARPPVPPRIESDFDASTGRSAPANKAPRLAPEGSGTGFALWPERLDSCPQHTPWGMRQNLSCRQNSNVPVATAVTRGPPTMSARPS